MKGDFFVKSFHSKHGDNGKGFIESEDKIEQNSRKRVKIEIRFNILNIVFAIKENQSTRRT